jgi:RNA polymerase sigma factor (sigma-70 family)
MAAGPSVFINDEAALYAAFHDELRCAVTRYVNTSPSNIEDACSDAWLALLRRKPDRPATVRGWLVVVAVREAIRRDRLDRRSIGLAGHGRVELGMLSMDIVPELHVTDAAKFEARAALERVAELRPRDRELFALHVAGFSYDEIAELMNMTYTAVNRYLARARAHVRGNSRNGSEPDRPQAG